MGEVKRMILLYIFIYYFCLFIFIYFYFFAYSFCAYICFKLMQLTRTEQQCSHLPLATCQTSYICMISGQASRTYLASCRCRSVTSFPMVNPLSLKFPTTRLYPSSSMWYELWTSLLCNREKIKGKIQWNLFITRSLGP